MNSDEEETIVVSGEQEENMEVKPKTARPRKEDSFVRIRKLAYRFQPLPTHSVQLLENLIENLLEERKQKVLSGDFKSGMTILRVVDHVKEFLKIAEKRRFQRQQKCEVSKQNDMVLDRIATFDQETAAQERKLKRQLASARERLINDLKKEAEQHEQLWQSESHKRLYNRPSHQLRALRHQAKQMVACGRFKDAEQVLATANELQEKEAAQGAFQMQSDYENATKIFDQKVANDLNTFDTDAQLQIDSFRARRASQRTVFQNQIKIVEQKSELVKDVERCWNANQKQVMDKQMAKILDTNRKIPRTTRSLGRNMRETEDKIILKLPQLNPKRPMEKPIPQANYL
ncbi:hypothetical protein TRFO_35310 [Tritrichomonas foetus]|uniref:Uncharacterized protein n=1 Tax=Tritrichomonas foetus TaxID=1144522 RepID=A0A1J4JLY2_9EUKA|nr:hypothetical protein TRFO_35310 [Tritrichomonas foetus]|eukprot:OHS98284.1 hypothetical protein TRFO_35310 [Tritrichomonas foetus]